MLKQYFSSHTKKLQSLNSIIVVLAVAAAGTYLLIFSHASTPYVSLNAHKGSLANGAAVSQNCSGASDGQCVVFGPGASSTTGKLLGIVDSGSASILQQLGANSERNEIDISGSTYNDPNYSGTVASWITSLTSYHIVPLPLMNEYVELNTINPSQFTAAVVNWCQAYCAGGTFYSLSAGAQANSTYAPRMLEILNEPYGNWWKANFPNNYTNATPTVADQAAYATLLKDVRAGLDSAGLSNIGILGAAEALDDNGFTAAVAADGGYTAVQGLAVHPYSSTPIAPPYSPTLTGGWDLVYYLHQTYSKDIYVTEDGWCVNVNSVSCGDSGNLTEAQKDANITAAIGQLATVSWIKGFWYFNLYPYSGNTYGLYDVNNNETPAWTAFQSAARANGF